MFCRGRPICRPGYGPSRKAPRADTQVRPYAITAARSSPPPTGATLVVRSNGPMYLGHGFRQPNSETEFGASVMGIGPYGWLQKVAATSRAALSEAESAGIVAGQIQFLPDK